MSLHSLLRVIVLLSNVGEQFPLLRPMCATSHCESNFLKEKTLLEPMLWLIKYAPHQYYINDNFVFYFFIFFIIHLIVNAFSSI